MELLLNQSKRILMFHIALFLVCLSVWLGLFYMVKHKIDEARVIEKQISEEKSYEDRNRSLRQLLADIQGDMTRLESRRPAAADGAVAFLETIESLGRASGAKVEVASVVDGTYKENPDAYKTLNLAVSAAGSWDNIYYFLNLLENEPYKMTISNMSVSNELPGGATSSALWKASLSLIVLQKK